MKQLNYCEVICKDHDVLAPVEIKRDHVIAAQHRGCWVNCGGSGNIIFHLFGVFVASAGRCRKDLLYCCFGDVCKCSNKQSSQLALFLFTPFALCIIGLKVNSSVLKRLKIGAFALVSLHDLHP